MSRVIPNIQTSRGLLVNATAAQALSEGATQADIDVAVAQQTKLTTREDIRARIATEAGDIPSLLGTTADVAALGLLGAMQLVIILSEKGSPEVKAAIEAAPIKMPIDKAKALIAAIVKGDVKVPAIVKGIETVYAEVAQRSTATANAMIPPKV